MARHLYEIAEEVVMDWRETGAKPFMRYTLPYVEAMLQMNKVSDRYGAEDGEMIVLYFLNNAQPWRGEKARAIKAELNELLAAFRKTTD
jgi:hypothetical protein